MAAVGTVLFNNNKYENKHNVCRQKFTTLLWKIVVTAPPNHAIRWCSFAPSNSKTFITYRFIVYVHPGQASRCTRSYCYLYPKRGGGWRISLDTASRRKRSNSLGRRISIIRCRRNLLRLVSCILLCIITGDSGRNARTMPTYYNSSRTWYGY